jgi:hypothetical protein
MQKVYLGVLNVSPFRGLLSGVWCPLGLHLIDMC